MNCSSCGKEIPDKSIFCLHCGKPVTLSKEKPEMAAMETNDTASVKNTNASRKPNIKKTIIDNWVVFFLGAMVTAFGLGFGAFKTIIEVANQEIVPKDCCIRKEDLVGNILKSEAIIEIEHLIEIGQSTKGNEAEIRIWLMRVLAFIHGLNLEKDSEWNGHPTSAVEADIRYALLDPSVEIQRQKTLGILQGFKAAFQTQAYNP